MMRRGPKLEIGSGPLRRDRVAPTRQRSGCSPRPFSQQMWATSCATCLWCISLVVQAKKSAGFEHGPFVGEIRGERLGDTNDRSRVTPSNFRHEVEMIKGTVVVAGERENFPVILPLIFKRGVAVRSVT